MGMDGGGNTYLAGYFADSLSFPGLPLMDYENTTSAMFLTRIGDISTNIPFVEKGADLEIYPVPSNGEITLRSSEPFTEILIHNTMGVLVYQESFTSRRKHTFQLEQAGYYACTVLSKGQSVRTRKLVVLR